VIGHVQFASVPDRGPPGDGVVDYHEVFQAIDASGWTMPLGAEYKVSGQTAETLNWLSHFSQKG
ncbi:MAG: TIM barrel protein, partial [Litorivicinaceae bacterium]